MKTRNIRLWNTRTAKSVTTENENENEDENEDEDERFANKSKISVVKGKSKKS